MANHPTTNPDKGAAYTGLLLAVIFLFVTVFSIVKLTNAKYAGEHGAATETR